MEYCYVVPSSDELYHYGVKGMHWGIRRYQPYPDGKNGQFIGKHAAKKAQRAMNFNSYRISQAEHYKNKSQKRKDKFLNKAKIAKAKGNLDKMDRMKRKANKEQEDINFHKNTINEAKKAINDSIKKLSAGGYDISSVTKKGKIFADRKISDALFRPRLDMASNGGLIGIIGAPKGDVTRYKVKENLQKSEKAKNHDPYAERYGKSPYNYDKNELKPINFSKDTKKSVKNRSWTDHTSEEKSWAYSTKEQQTKMANARNKDLWDMNFLEATQNEWFQGGDHINGKYNGKQYGGRSKAEADAEALKQYKKYLQNPYRYATTI